MTQPLLSLHEGARVLIIRLRSLGDCVLTTPAIGLLHSFRPDLEIGVAVEDRFGAVYEGNPAIARIIAPSRRDVLAFRARLAVNLHGGGRSAMLTLASMAPSRAGFAHFPLRLVYNIHIPRAQEILGEERVVHTVEHVASAMFHLGVPRAEIPRATLFAAPSAEPAPYCVVHPFASAPAKAWPAERFAAAARSLEQTLNLRPVVIGAASDDFAPFAEFRCLRGAPLSEVKSLLSGACCFLGNDSGPAHIAAAFGVPVTVLYGASDPVVWAPWRTPNETLNPRAGLDALGVDEVVAAVNRLLDRI